VCEQTHRFNNRLTDASRFVNVMLGTVGKRLMYKTLIAACG
jgi:hypothetical protein